jgi:hypothetical protein
MVSRSRTPGCVFGMVFGTDGTHTPTPAHTRGSFRFCVTGYRTTVSNTWYTTVIVTMAMLSDQGSVVSKYMYSA